MMAKRVLNRRELRKQADEAEKVTPAASATAEAAAPAKKKRAKAAAAPKVRKPRKKKEPPRIRARWGVFDGSMKQLAIFDYCDRAAAEAKLAALEAKKKGSHFMQIVKDEFPVPPPVEEVA